MSIMHYMLPWYKQVGYLVADFNGVQTSDGVYQYKYPLNRTGTFAFPITVQNTPQHYIGLQGSTQPGDGLNVQYRNFIQRLPIGGTRYTFVQTGNNNSGAMIGAVDQLWVPGQFQVDLVNLDNTDQVLQLLVYLDIPAPAVPDGYITFTADGWTKPIPTANYPYQQDVAVNIPVGATIKFSSGLKTPAAGPNRLTLWSSDGYAQGASSIQYADIIMDSGVVVSSYNISGTPPATTARLYLYNGTTNPGQIVLAYYLS